MGKLIMLTLLDSENKEKILVGSDSIIDVERRYNKHYNRYETKVQLRHAMVTSHLVVETVEDIYKLYNMKTISLKEYGRRVGCNENFKTLQEIQDYVEEHHDCTLWDFPLEELEYAKENCEATILVETEFGVRICEV